MPVGCPTCGTQNPDGSLFCQNCRTPLMAPPVGSTPTAPPPPSAPPPGYGAPRPGYAAPPPGYAPAYGAASPYYMPAGMPAGAPAPVHRTPTGLVIGAGIAAFVLLAILAVVVAFIVGSRSTGDHVAPTPPPTSAPPTIAPTTTPGSSPGTKPSPSPTPTGKPTPTTGGIETNNFTMGLAPGFRTVKSDTVTALVANETGSIFVSAGKQDHESSIDNEFAGIVDNLKQKYSQVSQCTKSADFTVDGVKGTIWGFNYLFTPQGGQATKVCDLFFLAIPDSDKTLFYEVEFFMADSDFEKFANGSALPEVATIHWKSF